MFTRCRAHSSRTGERCKKAPIRGATVCRSHGGAAPQVRKKITARDRIAELVDPAITRLEQLLKDPMPAVAMAAVKDILDRAGYGARQKVEQTGELTIQIEYVNMPLPTAQKPSNGHVAPVGRSNGSNA